MEEIRFGVLGCADIAARKMIPAIGAAGHRVVAVAGRDGGRARRFAARFGADGVAGYAALLDRPDVDAVYVPLPLSMHAEWTEAALRAGKHVLVEKSLTGDADTARDLVALAAERGLLLMENFAFLHHAQHDAVRRLIADGAVIVEDLLDPDLLGRFNAELDPLLRAADPGHDSAFINASVAAFFGERTRHVTGVAGRSRVFATEVLVHPVLLALADHVLLPACASYLLNVAHVLDRGPGAERQWPHRDEIVWSHLPAPHPEIELSAVIALSEFTAANGATVVAPGSHRWPDRREPAEDELVAAEMAPGAAVVYYGSTVHAGGGNRTAGQWRRGMHMSYVAGWLRTEENHYLSVPPDRARTLPRRTQELLGYGAHDALATGGGFLGAHELCDPVEALAAGRL